MLVNARFKMPDVGKIIDQPEQCYVSPCLHLPPLEVDQTTTLKYH